MSRRPPDRVDWVDRQRLAGGDLRAAERFLDVRRARHLRGAHHTWGVALGLDLQRGRGAGEIVVGPGLAYDAWGRELLVQQERSIYAAPEQIAAAQDLVVVLRSAGDGLLPAAEARVVSPLDPLALGRDVPLGSLASGSWSVDLRGRPHVARLAYGRLRCGVVAAGSLPTTLAGDHLEAVVDTSTAGFSSTPVYVVQALTSPAPPAAGRLWLLALRSDSVTEPTATGFTVELRAVGISPNTPLAIVAGGLPVGFSWTGFEPPVAYGAAAAPDDPCPCLV